MSILEDNELIALFMGYKPKILKAENISNPAIRLILGLDNDKNKTVLAVETAEHESLFYQPQKDWNQLMEAVEKIESDGDTRVEIVGCECRIYSLSDLMVGKGNMVDCYQDMKDYPNQDTKREAVYQAVLEYIKKETNNGK